MPIVAVRSMKVRVVSQEVMVAESISSTSSVALDLLMRSFVLLLILSKWGFNLRYFLATRVYSYSLIFLAVRSAFSF